MCLRPYAPRRELTGTTGTTEKMVINTWFMSHAHDDHFQAFARFININHAHFDLKNIVYNIDIERGDVTDLGGTGRTPASKKTHEAMQIISGHYPDAKYYKPHTGEIFEVAGIKFDVMYTHEDRLYPAADGSLSFQKDQLSSSGIDIVDVGGTYRNGMYNSNGNSDFNDTSTVLKITFPKSVTGGSKDVTSILYADLNLAYENVMKQMYAASAIEADIVMVPHHGFDKHGTDGSFLSESSAKIYLYPQNYIPILGTDGARNREDAGPSYEGGDDDANYYHADSVGQGYAGVLIRDRLLKGFANLFGDQQYAHGSAADTYRIYWGGNETAIIDIASVAGLKASSQKAAIDACVETREAMSFEYTGWQLDTPSKLTQTGVTSMTEGTANGNTSITNTQQIQFTPVAANGGLIQEGRYLLMSAKYGHIMSHDATAPFDIPNGDNAGTSAAGSIKLDSDGGSENTYYMNGNNVVLDHSDRDHAIWNLRQYSQAYDKTNNVKPDGTPVNGKRLAYLQWNNFATTKVLYEGIELQKRTKDFNQSANGTYDPSNAYWYSTGKSDSNDYETRYLSFNTDITPFKNWYRNAKQCGNIDGVDNRGNRVRYIFENMGDGTYVIYYKASDLEYYVLCCDESGSWSVKKFTGTSNSNTVDNINKEIDYCKIKLYKYDETSSTPKKVLVNGYDYYNIDLGTSKNAVQNAILANLVVSDPDRQNQHIPCSGTSAATAKVGYYWVDMADIGVETLNTANKTYTVDVFYRDDAGKDIDVGDVTVKVAAASVSANVGMVSQNSKGDVHGYSNGAATEDYVTIRYNGEVINVTAAMLHTSDGKLVDTSTAGEKSGLTVKYQGVTYGTEGGFTLHVGEGTIDVDEPEYPEPGSVKVGKETTTSDEAFADTGVANIELSATGKPLDKGVDLIVIVDLSSSMRYYKTSNAYACGPAYNTNGVKNMLTYEEYRNNYNTISAKTRCSSLSVS